MGRKMLKQERKTAGDLVPKDDLGIEDLGNLRTKRTTIQTNGTSLLVTVGQSPTGSQGGGRILEKIELEHFHL